MHFYIVRRESAKIVDRIYSGWSCFKATGGLHPTRLVVEVYPVASNFSHVRLQSKCETNVVVGERWSVRSAPIYWIL